MLAYHYYMPQKNTIAFYGLWPELQGYTKTKLRGTRSAMTNAKLSDQNIDKKTEVLAIFLDSPITKELLDKLPKLKMIAAMSTGYDHIDLKECKKRGIVVCNVPTYGENTVAEHTMALILGLTRKLFASVKRVKEGTYDFHGLRGTDLKGKTLGVIGTGHIGAHVIQMARAFEMRVIAYDKFPNKALAKKLGFAYSTLASLLAKSDIVTLHTPLFKETYHLINKKNIKKMKKGALIINTARGALVDPEALLSALDTGQLAGAGLDVMEDENLIQDEEKIISGAATHREVKNSLLNNMLIEHPNTIVTPHNAFNSTEALERIVDTTVDNIKSFLKKKPQNVVK